jgi:hypothetical protein
MQNKESENSSINKNTQLKKNKQKLKVKNIFQKE